MSSEDMYDVLSGKTTGRERVPDEVVEAAQNLVVGEFRVDVLAFGETRWATNALRFPNEVEALVYAHDLYSRWHMVDKMRIVPESTPDHEDYVAGSEHPDWSKH